MAYWPQNRPTLRSRAVSGGPQVTKSHDKQWSKQACYEAERPTRVDGIRGFQLIWRMFDRPIYRTTSQYLTRKLPKLKFCRSALKGSKDTAAGLGVHFCRLSVSDTRSAARETIIGATRSERALEAQPSTEPPGGYTSNFGWRV